MKRKRKSHFLAIVISLSILFFSCGDDNPVAPVTKEKISGVVQKGPFNIGADVILSELQGDLAPTGKQFTSQITANDGSFEYAGLELVSQYVTLHADGFYFNELKGANSAARLSLYALADISSQLTLNINVLTHLEKPRVEYLISQGSSFAEAKATAQAEVLEIFSISKTDIRVSEQLNIAGSGEDNAILLAVSSILQGFRTEAELQEMLNIIANDLKEDGTMDHEEVKSSLAGHSLYILESKVKQNLEDKYNTLGVRFRYPTLGNTLPCLTKTRDIPRHR